MLPGFIPGSRSTLMMDVVVVAMIAVVPLLTWSIWLVAKKKAYALHKRLQLLMGLALIGTVTLFEIEVRVFGWRQNAMASPYYETCLFPLLYVHLVFAITTFFLWIATLAHAYRRTPVPPGPYDGSALHRRLGKLTALGTYCTSMTGWTFYWMAFLA